MNRTPLIVLVLAMLLLPTAAQGQYNGLTPSYADELTVNVSPEYPAPGDKTSINLEMYTENLNTSSISWYQDGKLVLQGIGRKSYSLTAPQAGKQTVITIRITTENGASFSKTIPIRPVNVDIIWEGDSYTPPFYKGRALWSPQGELRVIAMSNFGASNRLIYKWTINGEVSDQSGYGQNSISLSNNGLGGSIEIELLVTDPNSNKAAQGYTVINPVDPSVVFYENNPLYGIIFDKAVTSINMEKDEISILAAPFNLLITRPTDINYRWSVNGALTDAFGRSIILRKPEGSGSSSVSLQVNNTSKVMQFAESDFQVKFK